MSRARVTTIRNGERASMKLFDCSVSSGSWFKHSFVAGTSMAVQWYGISAALGIFLGAAMRYKAHAKVLGKQ